MKTWLSRVLRVIVPTAFSKQSGTVRYAFSFLFVIALMLGVASVIGSSQAEIVLETSGKTVAKGETFSINVYAVATTPVNAVSLRINFPTETTEILGIDRGESVITLWTSDPRVENGTVILEGGTYRRGFVGKHLIATINVRAKELGQATFVTAAASLLAGDGQGTEISTNVSKQGKTTLAIGAVGDDTITGEATVLLLTDVNGDGAVALDDIGLFMVEWTKQNNRYDFNNDGTMNFRDFSIILANYFRSQ
jgi:hypothetical protein